jgi:hypothetical protein
MSNIEYRISNVQVRALSILDIPCRIFRIHRHYCRTLRICIFELSSSAYAPQSAVLPKTK